MPRKPSETLTPREAEVMDALWTKGECSAEEIRAAMAADLHDSTVRTVLRVLESKGQVSHRIEGKSYIYRAKVPREKVRKAALKSLIDRFFKGSAQELLVALIEDEAISPETIAKLRSEKGRESKPRQRKRA